MIDKLTQETDRAIKAFIDAIPDVQKKIYSKLLDELKQLTLYSDGSIKNNLENIKRISRIKKGLENIVLDKKYIASVSEYLTAFETVEKIQNIYFSKLSSDFTPMKVLAEVKKQAITDTAEMLTKNGVDVNFLNPIKEIIKTNITSGGSYAELTEQLRKEILGTPDLDGKLMKYAQQVTTDAINQYSAQYMKIITDDLGLKWMRFVGSLIKTSRPQCIKMVSVSYFHVNQYPSLIKGIVYGKQLPLGKNGLPLGFNVNTTVDNYQVLRNGYNCGHQFIPISEESVPKNIRIRVYDEIGVNYDLNGFAN